MCPKHGLTNIPNPVFEPDVFEPEADSDSDDTTIALSRHPHPVYHFDSVHLAVEDSLYRLPKRNLQVSAVFKGILGPPKSKSECVSRGRKNNETSQLKELTELYFDLNGEGESDEGPIVLEGIKKDDFDSFLKVLYPKRAYEKIDLTLSQWTAVLELAHKWGFDRLRDLAVGKLAKLSIQVDPVEKVYWANKFEVEEWYEDAYMNLAKREEPLTLEEAQKLGLEFVTKLSHVRERRFSTAHSTCTRNVAGHQNTRYSGTTCGYSVKNCPVSEDELRPIVRKVFGLKTVKTVSGLKPLRLSYAATDN